MKGSTFIATDATPSSLTKPQKPRQPHDGEGPQKNRLKNLLWKKPPKKSQRKPSHGCDISPTEYDGVLPVQF